MSIKEKYSNFATSMPKTKNTFEYVVFFYSTNAENVVNFGLSFSNSYCSQKYVIVFGEMEKGSPFSFNYLYFSFMPKTKKIVGSANNSTIANTPTERNAVTTLVVGNQTQNFLNCLVTLNELYSQISDAIFEMYGDSQVDKIMSGAFLRKHNALQRLIEERLCISISESLFDRHLKTI